jgi:hypothetical protein
MAHEIAKLLLEHAGTAIERQKAIETAVRMGMSLSEIDEYLEWLSLVRGEEPQADDDASGGEPGAP